MRGCIVVPYRDRASHLVEFMGIVGGYGLDIVVIEQERGVLYERSLRGFARHSNSSWFHG